MPEKFYWYATFASGAVAITLALILVGLHRTSRNLRSYSIIRWCLASAFAAYGTLCLLENVLIKMERLGSGYLSGCITLCIALLLACLISMIMLAIIRPQAVNARRIITTIGVVVPLCAILLGVRLWGSASAYKVIYGVILAIYVGLITHFIILLSTNYKLFEQELLTYYEEEDLIESIRWIKINFWVAMFMATSVLLFNFGEALINATLITIYTFCIIYMEVSFLNYHEYAEVINRAIGEEEGMPQEAADSSSEEEHPMDNEIRQCVEKWVEEKGYLDTSLSVKDITGKMGIGYPAFTDFIKRETGEDFRSWRIRLRIKEAQEIMHNEPSLSISDVAYKAGFNDRAYFYKAFQKVTGMSVRDFLNQDKEGAEK